MEMYQKPKRKKSTPKRTTSIKKFNKATKVVIDRQEIWVPDSEYVNFIEKKLFDSQTEIFRLQEKVRNLEQAHRNLQNKINQVLRANTGGRRFEWETE